MADAPIVMAVALGYTDSQRSVGIAFANLTTRSLGCCEFADDEQFCSLEAVLLQVAAKEVVIAKVSFEKFDRAFCISGVVMQQRSSHFLPGCFEFESGGWSEYLGCVCRRRAVLQPGGCGAASGCQGGGQSQGESLTDLPGVF